MKEENKEILKALLKHYGTELDPEILIMHLLLKGCLCAEEREILSQYKLRGMINFHTFERLYNKRDDVMNDIQEIFESLKWVDAATFLKRRREEQGKIGFKIFDNEQHARKQECMILLRHENIEPERRFADEKKIQATDRQLGSHDDMNSKEESLKPIATNITANQVVRIWMNYKSNSREKNERTKTDEEKNNFNIERIDNNDEKQNENSNKLIHLAADSINAKETDTDGFEEREHSFNVAHLAEENDRKSSGIFSMFRSFFKSTENDKGNTQLGITSLKRNTVSFVGLMQKEKIDNIDRIDKNNREDQTDKTSDNQEEDGKMPTLKEGMNNAKEVDDDGLYNFFHQWINDTGPSFTVMQLAAENNVTKSSIQSYFEFSANVRGNTPIHAAVFKGEAGHVIASLQKQPYLINKTNENNWAPIHYAAAMGHLNILLILIEKGANVMARTTYTHEGITEVDVTAIHLAANQGYVNVVKALLDYNVALVDLKCKHNSTPLHYAAWEGHTETVLALLDKGANINAKENYLCDKHGTEPSVTALHAAAREGHVETIRALLSRHADSNLKDRDGNTALHLAALCGKTSTVITLIEHDAGLIHIKNNLDSTPLHLSALKGDTEAVKVLLNNGADINAKKNYLCDKHGTEPSVTALHSAAREGHVETIQILLSHNADPNLKDRDGDTALHCAACHGYTSTAMILIEHDAGLVNVQNNDKKTALQCAIDNGQKDTASALKNKSNYSNLLSKITKYYLNKNS